MKELTYNIVYLESCNLCGADLANQKVIGKRLNRSQGFSPQLKNGITTTICRCPNCGVLFSNPMLIPEKIEMHYGMPAETYWKDEYFNLSADEINRLQNGFRNMLGEVKGKKILDIGAGIGKGMIALQHSGADVYGLEPSEPFYRKAIEVMKIEKEKIQLASIETADYAPNTFDGITFGAVLEHLYDPNAALLKAVKWIKPRGVIYISVPNANWLISRLVNFSYKIRGLDYVTNLSPMHVPFHIYEFTRKAFDCNSKINGYKILKIDDSICNTYMPTFLDPMMQYYMKKTSSGMELAVHLTK